MRWPSSTPDHWHAVMTVMAAKAGKDIFCQKPLTLTIGDGQDMIRAVRQHQRILQTGSQWRSNARVRFACELVRNGYIGQLKTIRTTISLNNKQGPGPGWQPMPVPEGFDYPMWLGPAPQVPYHKDRCIYKFRFNLDYSGGQITNIGAYALDIAQLGNGTELTGPVEVEGLNAHLAARGQPLHHRARRQNSGPGMPMAWNWSVKASRPTSARGLRGPRAGLSLPAKA